MIETTSAEDKCSVCGKPTFPVAYFINDQKLCSECHYRMYKTPELSPEISIEQEKPEYENIYEKRYFAIDPLAPRVIDKNRVSEEPSSSFYYIMAVATTMEDAKIIAKALNSLEKIKEILI